MGGACLSNEGTGNRDSTWDLGSPFPVPARARSAPPPPDNATIRSDDLSYMTHGSTAGDGPGRGIARTL